MSHKIVKTAIKKGSKGTIMHVYLESDGESGELDDYALLDQIGDPDFPETNDFVPSRDPADKLRIMRVWYSSSWFDLELKFDALEKTTPWVLNRDGGGFHDFSYFGGLKDLSDPERFGKLLITTSGFESPGARATLILDMNF